MSQKPGLAVITGASSGIGRAFAERLAAAGHPLMLVARREDRLRDAARVLAERYGIQVGFTIADLVTPEGRETCRDAIDTVGGIVDTVVLNAGFGGTGTIATIGREHQTTMVALNCEAVVDLATHVLPGMIERRHGTLIVVSSAAAWQPIPFMATYAATKAFELFFTEALAVELRGTGVRAIAVCPGPTATEFGSRSGTSYDKSLIPQDSVESVVDATFTALAKGRRRVPTGAIARLSGIAAGVLPRRFVVSAAGWVHKKFARDHRD